MNGPRFAGAFLLGWLAAIGAAACDAPATDGGALGPASTRAAAAGDGEALIAPGDVEGLRAALADPSVETVHLAPGTYDVGAGLFVGHGQTLEGAGRDPGSGSVLRGGPVGAPLESAMIVVGGAPAVAFRELRIESRGIAILHLGQGDLQLEETTVLAARAPTDDPLSFGGRAVVSFGTQDVSLSFRDCSITTGRETQPNGDWDLIGVFGGSYDLVSVTDCTLTTLSDPDSPFNSADGFERLASTGADEHVVIRDNRITATGYAVKVFGYRGSAEVRDNELSGGAGGVAYSSLHPDGGSVADNHVEVTGTVGRSYPDPATGGTLRTHFAAVYLGLCGAKFFDETFGGLGSDVDRAEGVEVLDNTLSGTPEYGIYIGDNVAFNYPPDDPGHCQNASRNNLFEGNDFQGLSPSLLDVRLGPLTEDNRIVGDAAGRPLTVVDLGTDNHVGG